MSSVPPARDAAGKAIAPRSDSRARDTRDRILDAAVTTLAEEGYARATTLRIQDVAGVSRGRLLHHFPSRDELLVAAVSHLATRRIHDLPAATDPPEDPVARIDAAVTTMWSTYRQPYFWAAFELWLAARSNDALAAALGPAERAVQSEIRASTAALFGPRLAAHPEFDGLVRFLNTSMRGAATSYAFLRDRDPDRELLLPTWRAYARDTLLPPEA